jgi:hypothetical protein
MPSGGSGSGPDLLVEAELLKQQEGGRVCSR